MEELTLFPLDAFESKAPSPNDGGRWNRSSDPADVPARERD